MTKQIQPHQQRVIDEEKELSDRIVKLQDFLLGKVYFTLPSDERARLREQTVHMIGYRNVLRERIAQF